MDTTIKEQMEGDRELSEDEKQLVITGWNMLARHIVEQLRFGFHLFTAPENELTLSL